MSMSATYPQQMDLGDVGSGSVPQSAMSTRQRDFARFYVLSGGNATKAAVLAGYSDSDPAKAGARCALNPKVIAEVKRLSVMNGAMLLPILIRRAFEIAVDPATPARDALTAVFGLADRLGMSPPKGGVQVNIGSNVTNGDANTLIQQVWAARTERLGTNAGDLSGIGRGMPDEIGALIEQVGGGESSPGSLPPPSHIPPHPAEPDPTLERDDDG